VTAQFCLSTLLFYSVPNNNAQKHEHSTTLATTPRKPISICGGPRHVAKQGTIITHTQ